jgi:hypothetical protein
MENVSWPWDPDRRQPNSLVWMTCQLTIFRWKLPYEVEAREHSIEAVGIMPAPSARGKCRCKPDNDGASLCQYRLKNAHSASRKMHHRPEVVVYKFSQSVENGTGW